MFKIIRKNIKKYIPILFINSHCLSCEIFIPHAELNQLIPSGLLHSIGLIESGKSVGTHIVAWPWTINVQGKGYMFKTKQEAIKAVQNFQKQGIESIDVGCMQVNLKHHPKAFRNLSEAFDPRTNVQYAAQFLSSLYGKMRSWVSAVAHYHSAKPTIGRDYQTRVWKMWGKHAQKNPHHITIVRNFAHSSKGNFKQIPTSSNITRVVKRRFIPLVSGVKRITLSEMKDLSSS